MTDSLVSVVSRRNETVKLEAGHVIEFTEISNLEIPTLLLLGELHLLCIDII